jgi:CRISPR-associated protein Csd1
MILQALVQHYEDLSASGKIVPLGWSSEEINFEVHIDSDGQLKAIVPIVNENKKGRLEFVPFHLKRSGKKPPPYFLCDGILYVLGIEKGKVTDKSRKYFNSFAKYNIDLLSKMPCNETNALIQFLQEWNPELAISSPVVQEAVRNGLGHGNVTFRVNGQLVLKIPSVCKGWDEHYRAMQQNGVTGTCLVTGEAGSIARIHNSVRGIYSKALAPNGWTLVSFDKGSPAYNSYGKEQGYNAPVSQYAAFAYTTALNHLLSDREHVYQIGDTTVVCWAEGGESAYQGLFGLSLFGASDTYEEKDLRDMVKKLTKGESVHFDETKLDPNKPFYVLGLSPNAARLSVRFFLRNSFGTMLQNVQAHYERLEIIRPDYDKQAALLIWKLLGETVNKNARDKSPSPVLAGEVLRAILTNTGYPATLLNGVVLRIRAEHEVTRGRAAIIKAYYLKNPNQEVPKEVLTVSLNPDSTNVPYVLGRLFSVLEAIQSAANPGINATIKDKYFNSASSIPATVFPTLLNLAQKHLRKLKASKPGLAITYEKQLSELAAVVGDQFPARLNLPQQGSFQLGYYHQTAARYQKKEENNHV